MGRFGGGRGMTVVSHRCRHRSQKVEGNWSSRVAGTVAVVLLTLRGMEVPLQSQPPRPQGGFWGRMVEMVCTRGPLTNGKAAPHPNV